ncbi:MAG: hypothetical protein EFKGCFLK_02173 [Rhodocyclaceae bacterium]|nr:hypothetical protein [Rhodocyclaceae bacterium]
MRQPLEGRRLDETLRQEFRTLRPDLLRHGGLCPDRRQLLLQGGLLIEDRPDLSADLLRHQTDARTRFVFALVEARGVRRQRRQHAGALQRRRDDLAFQLGLRAPGHVEQAQLARQRLLDELHLLAQLEREEPAQTLAVHGGGLLRRVLHTQRHRLAFVDQRRETDHAASADIHLHDFRQCAEAPGSQSLQCGVRSFLLHFGAGEGLLDLRGKAAAQRGEVARLPQHAAVLVDGAEVHEEVRRHHLGAEGIERQLQLHLLLGGARQRAQEGLVDRVRRFREIGDELVDGLQAVAVFLRQGLHELRRLLLEQARHQPLAAHRRHLVERRHRHGQRDAVVLGARLEVVGERIALAVDLHLRREALRGDAGGIVAHELLAREEEQLRLGTLGVLAPALEAGDVDDLGRNLGVVEGMDQLLVHQHVLPARLVFELLDVAHEFPVVLEEARMARHLVG